MARSPGSEENVASEANGEQRAAAEVRGRSLLIFFAELRAKPIGYKYRLANSFNFEKVQDR